MHMAAMGIVVTCGSIRRSYPMFQFQGTVNIAEAGDQIKEGLSGRHS